MYFTPEEMSLEHLPAPVIGEDFCSDPYLSPALIFVNNVSKMPTKAFLSNYPDKRPQEYVVIQTGIRLIDSFDGAINDSDAWQAFFDEIDFSLIQDQSVLEFMLAMPELSGSHIPLPAFEITGSLAHRLMGEFKKIRDVNTRIDYLPPEPVGPCMGSDDVFYHAYSLIEAGFIPSYYDGHTLCFERIGDLEKKAASKKDAYLPPDGSGYGYDGYGY